MKVFAIVLLLAATAYARSANQIQETGPPCTPRDPLFSPGPDALNATLHPLAEIHEGSSRGDLNAVGLSTFFYEYTVNLAQLTISFEIRLGSADVDAVSYEVTGYLDARPISQTCLPSGNFTGSGPAHISTRNARAVGTATLFINIIGNRITVRALTLSSVSFDSLALDFGTGWLIGGQPVDWASWSANIKTCFDAEYAANQAALTEKVRMAANNIIERYTLQEFLDLIGGGDGTTCPPPA